MQKVTKSQPSIAYSGYALWLSALMVLILACVLSALGARSAVRSWKVISAELA